MRKLIIPSFIFILLINLPLYSGFFENGCKQYSLKNYDAAKDLFLQSAETGGNANAFYFLGEIEKIQGNIEKSQEYFEKAITSNITVKYLKLAYWNLIVLKEQSGKYTEMTILCKDLWKKTEDDGARKKVDSLINKYLWTSDEEAKSLYTSGIDYKNNNKINEAKISFDSAIQKDSGFLAPKFELGLLYYHEKNINYALNYLKEIADQIPFYGEVHLLLGDIYFERQLFQDAINHFSKAIDYGFITSKTEYMIKIKRGTSYYKIGEYESAGQDIERTLEINSKAIDPLLLLSAIYINQNKYEEAIEILRRADKASPDNQEILFQIGSIYYKLNDIKYVNYFDRLFEKVYTKDSLPGKYYKAFIILANNHYENSRYEKAAKILKILPENFKDYKLLNLSAKTFYNLGDNDLAIEYFEKISLGNDDKFILCIAYARKGFKDKARSILYDLSFADGYIEKAGKQPDLMEIALSIENEKRKIEEDKKKAENERIKKQEEGRRLEEERREREEEQKRIIENGNTIEPIINSPANQTDQEKNQQKSITGQEIK